MTVSVRGGGGLALIVIALGCLSASASAQSGGPVGIVDSPCPAPHAVPPELDALTQDLLKPSNRFSAEHIEAILSSPVFQNLQKTEREQRERDWPNLCRYKRENNALEGVRPQVVFMGDSITENWVQADSEFFGRGRVGRGIGGQTSPQMLLRFYPDVIALQPRVVHLMVGTNDLAGRTGSTSVQDYKNNILAMLDLAAAHRIKVVLAGIPPASGAVWGSNDPRHRIVEINGWLRLIANQRNLIFVDYGTVLADSEGRIKESLSNDGIHPNRTGYEQMRPLAERAIKLAGAFDGV